MIRTDAQRISIQLQDAPRLVAERPARRSPDPCFGPCHRNGYIHAADRLMMSRAAFQEMLEKYGRDAMLGAIRVVEREDVQLGKAHPKGDGHELIEDD